MLMCAVMPFVCTVSGVRVPSKVVGPVVIADIIVVGNFVCLCGLFAMIGCTNKRTNVNVSYYTIMVSKVNGLIAIRVWVGGY